MVKINVKNNDYTNEVNSDGLIFLAIGVTGENGEKEDFGIGIHGKFSIKDAIEGIVQGVKYMFENCNTQDEIMDVSEMNKLFREAVNDEFSEPAGEITFTAEIDPEVLKKIAGL